ncbi:MAG: PAS domain-containing protein [Pseudomonadota bacterium]
MDAERQDTPHEVIDLIAESLMPGRRDVLRRIFNAHGARAPLIIWTPVVEELQSPLMRRFAEVCRSFADESGQVRDDTFSLEALGPIAAWMMIVEPEGDEFRYTHYGAGIAEHYGRDMTGETTHSFSTHIGQFFKALYRAAAERREWVLSEHEPPARIFVRSWRRLIVPLMDADGETVLRFAVANFPENELRAGLELITDPVFVLAEDHRVQYANRAAQRMFGFDTMQAHDAELTKLCGVEVDTPASPEDMLSQGRVDDSLRLSLRGGIAERLVVTVSAAEHRGTAFYVVVMRQIGA